MQRQENPTNGRSQWNDTGSTFRLCHLGTSDLLLLLLGETVLEKIKVREEVHLLAISSDQEKYLSVNGHPETPTRP